jgi:hypothetical protein
MGRECSTYGEKRNSCSDIMGTPEGKIPLARTGRGWENNNKINLGGIRWGGMDWIEVAQDMDQWRALVNTVMNLRFP